MDRRQFLMTSAATLFTSLVAGPGRLPDLLATPHPEGNKLPYDPFAPLPPGFDFKDGPAPLPEITAAVDVLVPPDPDIPNDFKGSDYNADWVVAATLGNVGQLTAVYYLDEFAQQTSGKKFIECSAEEQLEAIQQWIRDRETVDPMFADVLSGVLTVSMVGCYEENSDEEQRELFTSMGWFDPLDPAGTFRIPCEGYPDSYQFPVRLKRGVKND